MHGAASRDGKAAESEQHPTSFNALLGLQGDASRQFLLDQAALLQQPGVSSLQYADSRPSMTPFCSQQQQLPGGGFFISSSSGIFGSSPGPPPEHIKVLLTVTSQPDLIEIARLQNVSIN